MEMEGSIKEQRLRQSQDPIRCAKAAMLLLSLGSCREHQEKATMKQVIEDLRVEMVRERTRRMKLKLCNWMEFALQILFLFPLLYLLADVFFKSC